MATKQMQVPTNVVTSPMATKQTINSRHIAYLMHVMDPNQVITSNGYSVDPAKRKKKSRKKKVQHDPLGPMVSSTRGKVKTKKKSPLVDPKVEVLTIADFRAYGKGKDLRSIRSAYRKADAKKFRKRGFRYVGYRQSQLFDQNIRDGQPNLRWLVKGVPARVTTSLDKIRVDGEDYRLRIRRLHDLIELSKEVVALDRRLRKQPKKNRDEAEVRVLESKSEQVGRQFAQLLEIHSGRFGLTPYEEYNDFKRKVTFPLSSAGRHESPPTYSLYFSCLQNHVEAADLEGLPDRAKKAAYKKLSVASNKRRGTIEVVVSGNLIPNPENAKSRIISPDKFNINIVGDSARLILQDGRLSMNYQRLGENSWDAAFAAKVKLPTHIVKEATGIPKILDSVTIDELGFYIRGATAAHSVYRAIGERTVIEVLREVCNLPENYELSLEDRRAAFDAQNLLEQSENMSDTELEGKLDASLYSLRNALNTDGRKLRVLGRTSGLDDETRFVAYSRLHYLNASRTHAFAVFSFVNAEKHFRRTLDPSEFDTDYEKATPMLFVNIKPQGIASFLEYICKNYRGRKEDNPDWVKGEVSRSDALMMKLVTNQCYGLRADQRKSPADFKIKIQPEELSSFLKRRLMSANKKSNVSDLAGEFSHALRTWLLREVVPLYSVFANSSDAAASQGYMQTLKPLWEYAKGKNTDKNYGATVEEFAHLISEFNSQVRSKRDLKEFVGGDTNTKLFYRVAKELRENHDMDIYQPLDQSHPFDVSMLATLLRAERPRPKSMKENDNRTFEQFRIDLMEERLGLGEHSGNMAQRVSDLKGHIVQSIFGQCGEITTGVFNPKEDEDKAEARVAGSEVQRNGSLKHPTRNGRKKRS